MVIELLKFTIPRDECEVFVERNEAVWAAGLREHPGFVRHEVLRNRQAPEEVYISIYWESYEAWQSFPKERIAALDEQMQPHWKAVDCLALDLLHRD